jgi:hypothetical protein
MSVFQVACGVAAVAVAVWPEASKMLAWAMSDDKNVPAPKPLSVAVAPNYQTAIANLAAVRLRLLRTECLGDDQKKAIDVLTLALVDGSDQ